MALRKSLIPISFSQGIETKSDDKQKLAGSLTVLNNATFQKVNQISKRNGYNAFTTLDSDGVEILNTKAVATLNNELLLYTADSLFTYSPNYLALSFRRLDNRR